MNSGFINILKPPGMSSHDVVSTLRRVYGQKRIGHAGTLDPGAAGVLPVAVGQATRLIEYLTDAGKSYRAELTFGYATDSGDDFGKKIAAANFSMPDKTKLESVLASFLGESKQTPPMHSAIKVAGNTLYKLARQGISVEVPERTIYISKIALLSIKDSSILFDVDCSKGTYIRTLCMDIGKKLAIPAVMSFLIRTKVGAFNLADSFTLEEVAAQPLAVLLPMDTVLSDLPAIIFTDRQAKAFQQGQKIKLEQAFPDQSILRIYSEKKIFIGIGKYAKNYFHITPIKVIAY